MGKKLNLELNSKFTPSNIGKVGINIQVSNVTRIGGGGGQNGITTTTTTTLIPGIQPNLEDASGNNNNGAITSTATTTRNTQPIDPSLYKQQAPQQPGQPIQHVPVIVPDVGDLSHHEAPTRDEFEELLQKYVEGLAGIKRNKALITREMYNVILMALLEPQNTQNESPQFRHWARKHFTCVENTNSPQRTNIVLSDGKPVATRDQLYDIVVAKHIETAHGGRDKTHMAVSEDFAWIPKELITQFLMYCPKCKFRRRKDDMAPRVQKKRVKRDVSALVSASTNATTSKRKPVQKASTATTTMTPSGHTTIEPAIDDSLQMHPVEGMDIPESSVKAFPALEIMHR